MFRCHYYSNGRMKLGHGNIQLLDLHTNRFIGIALEHVVKKSMFQSHHLRNSFLTRATDRFQRHKAPHCFPSSLHVPQNHEDDILIKFRDAMCLVLHAKYLQNPRKQ